KLAFVARGADPRAAHDSRAIRALGALIDSYETQMRARRVVRHRDAAAVLRNRLLPAFGAEADVATITRAALIELIDGSASIRPGAAKELRKQTTALLALAVHRGLLPASPLAGWRRQRATRAERTAEVGRALDDFEIARFWLATAAYRDAGMGSYLRVL